MVFQILVGSLEYHVRYDICAEHAGLQALDSSLGVDVSRDAIDGKVLCRYTVRISLCLVACLCVLITETRVQWTSRIFWMDSDLVLHLHEKLYRKSSENTSGTTLSYGKNHTGDVSASASRLVDIKCENDSYART